MSQTGRALGRAQQPAPVPPHAFTTERASLTGAPSSGSQVSLSRHPPAAPGPRINSPRQQALQAAYRRSRRRDAPEADGRVLRRNVGDQLPAGLGSNTVLWTARSVRVRGSAQAQATVSRHAP